MTIRPQDIVFQLLECEEKFELVEIDCEKLDELVGTWQDPERLDTFERYLTDNQNVEAPILEFMPAAPFVRFNNGRHRYSYLYKWLGMRRIMVAVKIKEVGICRDLLR